MRNHLVIALLLAPACTTLGPTPLASGVSPRPNGRTSVTAGAGIVPGYFLSQATTDAGGAAALPSIAIAVEPGDDVPGLVVGARAVSIDVDGQFEPILGYRREFGTANALALGGFLSGAHSAGAEASAAYQVDRVAGEVAFEARLTDPGSRFAVHGTSHATFSVSQVDGHYCVDTMGNGVDCSNDASVDVDASATLVAPALGVGLALTFTPRATRWLHRARLAAEVLAARVPRIANGAVDGGRGELSVGLSLEVSAGAR